MTEAAIRAEFERLCTLDVFGGVFDERLPALHLEQHSDVRRCKGEADLDDWLVVVHLWEGQSWGETRETMLHELVHLSGPACWRGHYAPFKRKLLAAALEAWGLQGSLLGWTPCQPYRQLDHHLVDALDHPWRTAVKRAVAEAVEHLRLLLSVRAVGAAGCTGLRGAGDE